MKTLVTKIYDNPITIVKFLPSLPPPPTFLTSKMQDLFMSLLILIRKFLIEVESTININVFKL